MKTTMIRLMISMLLPLSLFGQGQGPISFEGQWAEGSSQAVFRRTGATFIGNGALLEVYETISSVTGPIYQRKANGVRLMDDVVEDIWVSSDGLYAYVACGLAGVAIVPYDPATGTLGQIAARINTPGFARGVYQRGQDLYVADGETGLRVYNVVIPTDPLARGTYLTADDAQEIWVYDDNTVLVAANSAGLYSIDVTDRYNPQLLDQLVIAPLFSPPIPAPQAWHVIANDSAAYVASGWGGLTIVDIRTMTDLKEWGRWTWRGTPVEVRGVWYSGNYAYLACGEAGFFSRIDISDASAPTGPIYAPFDTEGMAHGVVVSGDTAFVAAGHGGHWKIRVDEGAPSVEAAHFKTADVAHSTLISGNYAYVAAGKSGVQVVDLASAVGDDQLLQRASALNTEGEALGLAMQSSRLFIADGSRGLSIANIISPTSLQISESAIAVGDTCYDVDVPAGPLAYLASGGQGMRVVDWGQNPPSELGFARIVTAGICRGINVENNRAVLAASQNVFVYDVSGLSSNIAPVQLHSLTWDELDARNVDVQGDTVAVANGIYGVLLWNTETGAVDTMSIGGTVTDVILNNRTLYVTDGDRGFRVFDLSRPGDYEERGAYNTRDFASGLAVNGVDVAVADRRAGMYAFEAEIQPSILVSSDTLHFGPVANGRSRPRKFYIINTGSTLLSGSIVLANHKNEFSFSQTTFAIAPEDTAFITMTFTPDRAYSDNPGDVPPTSLTLLSNDPDNREEKIVIRWVGGMPASEFIPYEADLFTRGLWHFNQSGGTSFTDASGGNHHGLVSVNTEFVLSGKEGFGNGIRFNEETDLGTVAYHDDFDLSLSAFTVEFWFQMAERPSTTGSGYFILLQRGLGNNNTQFQFALGNEHNPGVPEERGGLMVLCEGVQADYRLHSGSIDDLMPGHWYHAALTSDREFLRLFLNGVEQDMIVQSGALVAADGQNIGFGASAAGNSPFKGMLEEVRISNVDRQPWELHVNRSQININASAVDFGRVLIGENRSLPVIISNPGSQNLEITGMAFSGTDPALTLQPTGAQTLEPGQSMTVHIIYAPGTEGVLADVLEISNSDPNRPVIQIPLSGEGIQSIPAGGYISDALTVGLWHFDDTGGTTLADASPAAMHGVWPPQRKENGQFGHALLFIEGEGDLGFITPQAEDFIGPRWGGLTIEGWIYYSAVSSQPRLVVGREAPNLKQFEIILQNQTLYGRLYDTAAPQNPVTVESTDKGNVTIDTWHHFAMTYDGEALRLFLNGDEADQQPFTATMAGHERGSALDTASVRLGRDWDAATGRGFVGRLDEMRISNVARQRWEFNVDMARVAFSSDTLDFDEVALNESRMLKLRIENTGIDNLEISQVVSTSTRFTADQSQFTIVPGTSQILKVHFQPLDNTPVLATLAIKTNDPFVDQANIVLMGKGRTGTPYTAYRNDPYTALLYHFDATEGAEVADSSAQGSHGVLSGTATWFESGRYGGALAFDGVNNRVTTDTIPGFEQLFDDYTVEFWFNIAEKPAESAMLFTRGDGDRNRLDIRLDKAKGLVATVWDSTGTADSLMTGNSDTLALNRWYHTAFSWDGDSLRLALNKVDLDCKLWHGPIEFGDDEVLTLGASAAGGSHFSGRLDDLRLSRVARVPWEMHVKDRQMEINPSTLDFATVLQDQERTLEFGIHNLGDQNLEIYSITGGGDFFSFTEDLNAFTLGRASLQAVSVTYRPTTANEAHEDSLVIVANTGRVVLKLQGASTDARSMKQYSADSHTLLLYHLNQAIGTVVPDSSGRNIQATIENGAVLTAGLFGGKAIRFDGRDDYLRVPYNVDFDFDLSRQDYTIEFYFKTDTVDQGLVFFSNGETAKFALDISPMGRVRAFGFGEGSGPRVNDGAWHHVALMFSHIEQNGRLYVDGVEIWEREWLEEDAAMAGADIIIGARSAESGHFQGAIDEIRLSDIPRERWEFQFIDFGIIADPPVTATAGQALTLTTHLPRVIVPQNDGVRFFYRQGGSAAYAVLPTTANDTTHTAVVPADDVSNRGLEYYIEISTVNNDTLTYPTLDPVSRPLSVSIAQGRMEAGVSLVYRQYEMISVPFHLNEATTDSVLADFGPYNPFEWELYWWDPVASQERWDNENPSDTTYVHVTDSTNGFHFVPGRAFWVASSDMQRFNIGPSSSVTTDSSYQLILQPGWNMVANPFNFTVNWDDCSFSDSTSGLYFYREGATAGPTQNWPQLDPWKGYWIHNPQDDPVYCWIMPRAATASGLQKTAKRLQAIKAGEWRIKLSAETETTRDLDNFAGVHGASRNGWDITDNPEPPAMNPVVDLYFDHWDWEEHATVYASDMREPGGEGQSWSFKVDLPRGQKTVKIKWDIEAALPDGWQAYVLHEDNGSSVNLTETGSITLKSSGQSAVTYAFKLIAGSPGYIEALNAEMPVIPVEFELNQNYPNPFNPETKIPYSVPKNGSVKIDIFNSLGQLVQTVVDEEMTPGRYDVIWDGRDRRGHQVASGVYLCRFKAAGKVAIRKMVLVR